MRVSIRHQSNARTDAQQLAAQCGDFWTGIGGFCASEPPVGCSRRKPRRGATATAPARYAWVGKSYAVIAVSVCRSVDLMADVFGDRFIIMSGL
jgi:hypothetical protein